MVACSIYHVYNCVPLPHVLFATPRLTPAAEGNVGASRGEVDAGVLNAFVLAIEQVRVER